MKVSRALIWLLAAVVFVIAWPGRALAIPVFARKYDFRCTMCHVQYPKLNDFGQAFRDNGYRIMGKEAEEKTAFETQTPIALRTSFGYNRDTFRNPGGTEDNVRAFQLNNLDLLSGGLFSEEIGYIGVYLPEMKGSRSVVAQTGTTEMANLVYSVNRAPLPFTIRAGRFEPGYLPFSAKRTFTVSPYEIYDFSGPDGLALGNTQDGVELAGVLPGKLKLAAGWVNGSDTQTTNDSPGDFYLRANKVFGQGEGQVVGQRLGAFAYFGKGRLEGDSGDRKNLHRYGADLSLNFGQTNLLALYLTGKDDKELNSFDPSRDYDFSGGFVEVNHSLPNDIIGFARWDWVNTPAEQDQDHRAWTVGVRYYPAMNTALHLEYSDRKIDHGAEDSISDFKERMFTARVDVAF